MKYLNYIFRIIIMTLIVLPMWISICIIALIISFVILFLVQCQIIKQEKYRNNTKSIINDFKQDMSVLFMFYIY
jgi:hypothetical protein